MSTPAPYEVYAVRYARHEKRTSEIFLGGDPHDAPVGLDYYVWAVVGDDGAAVVIDTGFDETVSARRNRPRFRCPGEGLAMIGVDHARVHDVVITHMHYDHCGNHHLFPEATFHLHEKEMAYATGRHMCHGAIRFAYEAEDVCAMVRRLFSGRLRFHGESEALAPGLSLHHIGGHTMGMQAVRVWTRRGWVVLASDAAHYYANIEEGRPFPIVYNLGDVFDGYATMRRLASSPRHIVPGHDPLVMQRYPAARPGLEGIAVRLDVEPGA